MKIKTAIILVVCILLTGSMYGCVEEKPKKITMTFREFLNDSNQSYNNESKKIVYLFESVNEGDILVIRDIINDITYSESLNYSRVHFLSSFDNNFSFKGDIRGIINKGDGVEIKLHIINVKVTERNPDTDELWMIEMETFREGWDKENQTHTPLSSNTIHRINDHNQTPICILTGHPSSGFVPLTVIFTLTTNQPGSSFSSWSLDINDDGTMEYSGIGNPPITQSHTYLIPGDYTARFMVTDTHGGTDSNTLTIHVKNLPFVNQSAKVGITPISSTIGQGEDFCINISIDSQGLNIRTVGFQLTYPSIFTVKSFTYENLLGTEIIQVGTPNLGDNSGLINYAVSRTDGGADPENGSLVTICFMLSETAIGTYDLDLHDTILVNESISSIPGIMETDAVIIISSH